MAAKGTERYKEMKGKIQIFAATSCGGGGGRREGKRVRQKIFSLQKAKSDPPCCFRNLAAENFGQ